MLLLWGAFKLRGVEAKLSYEELEVLRGSSQRFTRIYLRVKLICIVGGLLMLLLIAFSWLLLGSHGLDAFMYTGGSVLLSGGLLFVSYDENILKKEG